MVNKFQLNVSVEHLSGGAGIFVNNNVFRTAIFKEIF